VHSVVKEYDLFNIASYRRTVTYFSWRFTWFRIKIL